MGCVLEQPNQRLLHATATSSAAAEEAFNLGTTTHQPRKLAEERVYQVRWVQWLNLVLALQCLGE